MRSRVLVLYSQLADHGGLRGQLPLVAQPVDARPVEPGEGDLELLALLDEVLQALQEQLPRLLLLGLQSLDLVRSEAAVAQLLRVHD